MDPYVEMIPVRSWRIQQADPTGSTMWFEPGREVPLLVSLPCDSEFVDMHTGEVDGTYGQEEGNTCEGGDAETSHIQEELPF